MPGLVENHPTHVLTPHRPSFWCWDSGSIAFTSGPTLTFREELLTMIQHLQPRGMPPMESLLLFLAATRDPWSHSGASGLETAWNESLNAYDPALLRHHLPENWRTRIARELGKVHGLDRSWRHELRKKCLVAEVCFESCRALAPPDHARKVADLLELGFVAPAPPPEVTPHEAVRRLAVGVRPLLEGFPELREDRLAMRLRTGLDVPLSGAAAVEEPSLALQVRALLAELEGDPKWAGLARLAKNLMAAVHLPRALGDLEDLPLGGFSDITNRGSLDRLLVSELAQDDLVFTARLALHEALYLRRESPPKTPQVHRMLLVDNGLRLWGIPRLFAVAVALAMDARSEAGTKVASYVPTQHQQLEEVRLHTREGLLEALSHLHPHAHPGNALLEMARRMKECGEHAEMILVTHADVLDDPAFRSVVALLTESFFVATVDRTGAYVLYRYHQTRRRVLGSARLDLTQLMEDEGGVTPLRRPDIPDHLPSIFHERPFPIRLPILSLRDRTVFTRAEGIYKTSRDGRLLHFDDPKRGGVQICDDLPPGRSIPVVEVQPLGGGRIIVALQGKRRLSLAIVHPDSGGREMFDIAVKIAPLQVLVVHQHLLVVHHKRITMHAVRHGEQEAELVLSDRVDRCYGDMILMGSEWRRVCLDGMRPCLETVDQDQVMESSKMEEYRLHTVGGLRKRFRGVALVQGRVVLFPGKSGPPLALHYCDNLQSVQFRPLATTEVEPILFRTIAGPEGSRLVYKEAVWPEESRVVLDSRGLLHFVSSSKEIQEFTLILADSGPLSAWLGAEGGMGEPFYFNQGPTARPAFFGQLLQSFARQISSRC